MAVPAGSPGNRSRDALYTFAVTNGSTGGGLVSGSTTSSVGFRGIVTVTGASRVCSGTCQIVGTGMLAGPGANRIGFTYKIGSNTALFPGFGVPVNGTNLIYGAAIFARR